MLNALRIFKVIDTPVKEKKIIKKIVYHSGIFRQSCWHNKNRMYILICLGFLTVRYYLQSREFPIESFWI